MKVINLTPHNVDIVDDRGNRIKTYVASGKVARINNGWNTIDYVDGVPLVVRQNEKVVVQNNGYYGRNEKLPEPQDGVMYIVSNVVLDYCTDRMDLIAPVMQVKIDGRVVGCRGFVSNR